MRRGWRRWVVRLAVLVVLAGNVLVVFCWWHNVWSLDGWTVYRELGRRSDPAWRDYHFGRVRAGDPVDPVIARTAPVAVERRGRWTVLQYKGMAAVACDGRMVYAYAMSCCWTRIFFDEVTDAQGLELFGRPKADVDERLRQDRRQGLIVVK